MNENSLIVLGRSIPREIMTHINLMPCQVGKCIALLALEWFLQFKLKENFLDKTRFLCICHVNLEMSSRWLGVRMIQFPDKMKTLEFKT